MSSDAPTSDGAATAVAGIDQADASRRLLEESFNDGNLALIDELVLTEAVNHDPAEPAELRALRGPEAMKRIVTMYRSAFPDVHMTVDDVITAGDKVVLRWHSEGTHSGGLQGLAPTRAHGSVTGISINQWKDGKIAESWVEWDNLGLARQLGAAPREGSIGEKLGLAAQRLMAVWMRRNNPA